MDPGVPRILAMHCARTGASAVFDQAMSDKAGSVIDYGALTLRDWVSYWLACWRGRARNRRHQR